MSGTVENPAGVPSQRVVTEASRSVAHKALPPMPTDLRPDADGHLPVTLVLFYQYVEPPWTAQEHKAALKFATTLAKQHDVCGRGRCASEGLNCSLTGPPASVRAFCNGLREWNPLFEETDFKLTDGVPYAHRFKAFTLRKTDELVAYGLAHEKAPTIKNSRAEHLEAIDYHKMMEQKNTVIIDVRNAYESAIGHFAPPPGGAELIDPKMRNSHEFPKWLNAPETRAKLEGKKVMMYCTGGIRCERATALLDQLEHAGDLKTDGVVMVRGGIERYLKTYPEGGYWRGKNYLFDRRLEQVAELAKPAQAESWCSVCGVAWDTYRGQYKCGGKLPPPVGMCGVPVLVCNDCIAAGRPETQPKLLCPLCTEGYLAPQALPSLGGGLQADRPHVPSGRDADAPRKRRKGADAPPCCRLFVGSLPLATDAAAVRRALGFGMPARVELIHWLQDRETKLFYGSAFVRMDSVEHATEAVAAAATAQGVALKGRTLRVSFSPPKEEQQWPPDGYAETERPPLC